MHLDEQSLCNSNRRPKGHDELYISGSEFTPGCGASSILSMQGQKLLAVQDANNREQKSYGRKQSELEGSIEQVCMLCHGSASSYLEFLLPFFPASPSAWEGCQMKIHLEFHLLGFSPSAAWMQTLALGCLDLGQCM